jgi:excisionase family DNA binding protein
MRSGDDSGPEPVKRLYTIEESAMYLGRTPWAIRHLVWRGELPCVRIGRRVQIDVRDLDALIERCKAGRN